jgi:hypothetical protein
MAYQQEGQNLVPHSLQPLSHRILLHIVVPIPLHDFMREAFTSPADQIAVGCRADADAWCSFI